jgi:hypothetical protein
MLLTGIMIGMWIGVPIGILLVAMLGPREQESARSDTRSMHDLLARHFPSAASADPVPNSVDETAPGRRHAR